MGIRHRIDLILKIKDSFTNKGIIKSKNCFKVNGIEIKPTKTSGEYFIFCNLFENKYLNWEKFLKGEEFFSWNNSFYSQVKTKYKKNDNGVLKENDYLEFSIRGFPTKSYPFPKSAFIISDKEIGAEKIRYVHRHNKNKMLLKSDIGEDRYIDIAQNINIPLEGRKFQFSEGENIDVLEIHKDIKGYYFSDNLEFLYTPACEILEVFEVKVEVDGSYIIGLSSFEKEELEAEIEIFNNNEITRKNVFVRKGR